MPIFGLGKKKEKKAQYTMDMSGPCGRRADKCERYREYFSRPNPKYKSACEACEENPLLD